MLNFADIMSSADAKRDDIEDKYETHIRWKKYRLS